MVSWWNLFQAIIVVVAFGGIDGRGFGNLQMEPMFDRQNKGMKLWWRLTRIEDLLGKISKGAKPKSSQRPSGLKKTF